LPVPELNLDVGGSPVIFAQTPVVVKLLTDLANRHLQKLDFDHAVTRVSSSLLEMSNGKVSSSTVSKLAIVLAVGECQLAASTSSIGAGAAMSLGKKMRELTANRATKKTSTIRKGAMY
jgi:hypothetical protein